MAEKEAPQKKWYKKWISLPFIIIMSALTVLLFFQDNNYFVLNKNKERIDELKMEIKRNLDSARYYNKKAQELNTDAEQLEKISREQYRMQRLHEDVYLVDIK